MVETEYQVVFTLPSLYLAKTLLISLGFHDLQHGFMKQSSVMFLITNMVHWTLPLIFLVTQTINMLPNARPGTQSFCPEEHKCCCQP